jgi:hypothetical protein
MVPEVQVLCLAALRLLMLFRLCAECTRRCGPCLLGGAIEWDGGCSSKEKFTEMSFYYVIIYCESSPSW